METMNLHLLPVVNPSLVTMMTEFGSSLLHCVMLFFRPHFPLEEAY